MLKSLHRLLYQTAIVWKTAFASGIAWEVATLAGSSHPYLAPLSVILCLQVTVGKSIKFGFQRVLGTIAGVLFVSYLTPFIDINPWTIASVILISSLIVYLMGFDKSVINQVALSILLVLAFEKHSDYGFDRIKDTCIGCLIAILMNMFVFPPDFTDRALAQLKAFREKLMLGFSKTSHWLNHDFSLEEGQALQKEAEKLTKEFNKTFNELNGAKESLRYHPFVKKSYQQLELYSKELAALNLGYRNLLNILQTLIEWNKNEEFTNEEKQFWANRLNTIAYTLQRQMMSFQGERRDSIEPLRNNENNSNNQLQSLILPKSQNAYRFAFSLQNDTLQLLNEFEAVFFLNKVY